MSEATYDNIHERINELTNRERSLRSEIFKIRQERSRLKSQFVYTSVSRPRWMSDIPEDFWQPCYRASKVISELSPNLDNGNVPPDLSDWSRKSGLKEFFINVAMYVGVAIIALQLFFFLL